MDIIDEKYDSTIYRTIKFGASFGMGKAIDKIPWQKLKFYINAMQKFGDAYITPILEQQWNSQNKPLK